MLVVILLTMASVEYGLGRLPGDIVVDLGSFYFYLPFTTALVVAVLVSPILWFFSRR
ncbi:MAG: DUF2905 domain-containing protein [Alphaproteobacteria bacterium]